jgi:hypothetical protein
LESRVEFDRGAASIHPVFEIEGSVEPLIEGEAIDSRTGVPAGEKNPAGGQAKESEQEGDPEAEAGLSLV